MKNLRLYLICLGVFALGSIVTSQFCANCRSFVFAEDQLLENFTAACLVIAAVFAAAGLIRFKDHRAFFVMASLIGLLGFLDELSFGERIFGFTPPTIRWVRVDAAHDTLYIGYHFFRAHPLTTTLVVGVLVLALVVLFRKYRSKLPFQKLHEPHCSFLLICLGLGLSALMIDLLVGVAWQLKRIASVLEVFEELLETGAAMALVFAVLSVPAAARARAAARNESWWNRLIGHGQ